MPHLQGNTQHRKYIDVQDRTKKKVCQGFSSLEPQGTGKKRDRDHTAKLNESGNILDSDIRPFADSHMYDQTIMSKQLAFTRRFLYHNQESRKKLF